jgi:hypothetical protein
MVVVDVVVEAMMMVTMAEMICDPGREDWARFGRLARGRLSLLLYVRLRMLRSY